MPRGHGETTGGDAGQDRPSRTGEAGTGPCGVAAGTGNAPIIDWTARTARTDARRHHFFGTRVLSICAKAGYFLQLPRYGAAITPNPTSPSGRVRLDQMLSVVIPSYRVKAHVQQVIERIGPEVAMIFVVDDACPEKSGGFVEEHCRDPRVCASARCSICRRSTRAIS
jgi:hypothetical protein